MSTDNDWIDNLKILGFDQAEWGLTERIRHQLKQSATREPIVYELVNRLGCIRYTSQPQTRLKVDVNRIQALAYDLSRDAHVVLPNEGQPEIIIQTNAPRNRIIDRIFHELGHIYYKGLADDEKRQMLDHAFEEIEEFISPEAAESPEENFSEVFVYYFLNPIELQQTCQLMYQILEEFFQKAK